MSENDIRGQCTEAQAGSVLQLISEGWEWVELEACGEVMLRSSGHCKWVKKDGRVYPKSEP